MNIMKYRLLVLFFSTIVITSCNKEGKGIPEAQGGLLPTNYITIKATSFSPANITAVKGSSFTFVNQSGAAQGIYSYDSVFLNKQGIADNTSYYFKKDTVSNGPVTIFYFMAGKPSVAGSITLTP
jgi:hypothetical protein